MMGFGETQMRGRELQDSGSLFLLLSYQQCSLSTAQLSTVFSYQQENFAQGIIQKQSFLHLDLEKNSCFQKIISTAERWS